MHDVLSKLSNEDDHKEFEDLKLRADEKLREGFCVFQSWSKQNEGGLLDAKGY